MQEVVIKRVLVAAVGYLFKFRLNLVVGSQQLVAELRNHVKLLEHADHVADVTKVLDAAKVFA